MSQVAPVLTPSQRIMPKREAWLHLSGGINEFTIRSLLCVVNQQYAAGVTDFTLLLSSRGGNTQFGHTAYHHLKALPINLTTWNMGAVGSSALNLYCAGKRRCCVPEAKFWLQCTDWMFQGRPYDLTELRPIMAEMEQDMQVSAQILAASTGQSVEFFVEQMCAKANWTPEQAVERGLANEVVAPSISGPVMTISDGVSMGMPMMQMMAPQMRMP